MKRRRRSSRAGLLTAAIVLIQLAAFAVPTAVAAPAADLGMTRGSGGDANWPRGDDKPMGPPAATPGRNSAKPSMDTERPASESMRPYSKPTKPLEESSAQPKPR